VDLREPYVFYMAFMGFTWVLWIFYGFSMGFVGFIWVLYGFYGVSMVFIWGFSDLMFCMVSYGFKV